MSCYGPIKLYGLEVNRESQFSSSAFVAETEVDCSGMITGDSLVPELRMSIVR